MRFGANTSAASPTHLRSDRLDVRQVRVIDVRVDAEHALKNELDLLLEILGEGSCGGGGERAHGRGRRVGPSIGNSVSSANFESIQFNRRCVYCGAGRSTGFGVVSSAHRYFTLRGE